MESVGRLMLISGLSGSGKSTLVEAALGAVDNTGYVRTTATRGMRPGDFGFEYDHVDWDGYWAAVLAAGEENWDGAHYGGNGYGADVRPVNESLRSGVNMFCGATPDPSQLDHAEQLYVGETVFIWVDTDFQTAAERVWRTGDPERQKRVWRNLEDVASGRVEKIKRLAGVVIFRPSGDLETDKGCFIDVIKGITRGANRVR